MRKISTNFSLKNHLNWSYGVWSSSCCASLLQVIKTKCYCYLGRTVQKRVLGRTTNAQKSWWAVWSGPSQFANRIIGYYKMYEWRAKAQMVLYTCTGCSESEHVRRHFFTGCSPTNLFCTILLIQAVIISSWKQLKVISMGKICLFPAALFGIWVGSPFNAVCPEYKGVYWMYLQQISR